MLGLTASANSYYPLDGLIYFINKYSIDFDGVDDRIITDGADTVAQPTTYSFWCKSSETGNNEGVFGHGNTFVGGFHFNAFGGDRPILYLEANYYRYWDDTSAQDDGEWHHWVVYVDTNNINNSKLYVDGVLQNASSTVSSGSTNAYTESLTIGADRQSGGNCFVGKIDEFAVFDRELTQAEITRMYNSYYTTNLVQNGNFDQIGLEEVTNGDFSQIGNEEVTNGDFSQIGSELVTNGYFATDTDWSKVNATISGGKGNLDSSGGSSLLFQSALVVGKNYKATLDVSNYNSTGVCALVDSNGTTLQEFTSNGSKEFYFTHSGSNTNLTFRAISGGVFSIDNVSVKEVGQDWSFGTGWSMGDGLAECDGTQSTFSYLTQTGLSLSDKLYQIKFSVTRNSGALRPQFVGGTSNVESSDIQSSGEYTLYMQLASNTTFRFRANSSFVGSIDNISVKEVGQGYYWGTGWSTDLTKATTNGTDTNVSGWLRQFNVLTAGKSYKATFDVDTNDSGAVLSAVDGNHVIQNITGSGSKTIYFKSAGSEFSFGQRTGKSASITNISVKEVGQHWTVSNSDADNYVVFNGSTARLKFLNTSPITELGFQNITLNAGTTYKIIVDVASVTSGSIKIDTVGISEIFDTAGVTTRIVTPTSNTSSLSFYRNTADVDITLNSVVIQELKHDATNLLLNSGDYQSATPLITSTKSMEFDGTDDYLNVGNNFNYTSDFSLSVWLKTESATSSYEGLISKYSFDSGGTGYDLIMKNGQVRMAVRGSSSIDTGVRGSNLNDGNWHNVVVTVTNASIKIYTDGSLIYTKTGTWTPTTNTNDFVIGHRSGINYFDGKMTEVGTWDRELTGLEVASLYNQGVPTDLLVNRNNYQSGNPTVFNTKQVDFDGADDYLELGSQSGVLRLAGSNGCISAWIKPTLTGDSYQRIVDKSDGVNAANGYALLIDGGNINAFINGSVSSIVSSTTTLTANRWYHIVWTWDGTNHKLYIDSVLEDTTSSSTTPPSVTTNMRIGTWNHSTGREYNGEMSQIGIWNEALTADEVSSLYNHGLPIDLTTDQAAYASSSNLVGYWRMGSGVNDAYPLIADQTNPNLEEKIVNGSFTTDLSGWTINNWDLSEWTSQGLHLQEAAAGQYATVTQNIPLVVGKTYNYSVTLVQNGAAIILLQQGSNTTILNINSSGTYTGTFVASQSGRFGLKNLVGNDADWYISNISLTTLGGNPAIMTNQTSSDIENGSPYANIVQNSDFSDTSFWTVETPEAEISNGKVNFNTTLQNYGIYKTSLLTSSVEYKVVFTIDSYTSGAVHLNIGGSVVNSYNAIGTYTAYVTGGGSNVFGIQSDSGGAVLSINNVTVAEANTGLQGYWKMGDGTNDEYPVIYDQTNPTLGSNLTSPLDFTTWINSSATDITANSFTTSGSGQGVFYSLTTNKVYQVNVSGITGDISIRYRDGGGAGTVLGAFDTDLYFDTSGLSSPNIYIRSLSATTATVTSVSIKEVQGNPATMTNMVEGNITNQYPLTKIRNYYRMGDGNLDGYPIIQDQTSPNLAHIPTTNEVTYSEDFSQWTANGVTVESGFTSPFGNNTAFKITKTTADGHLNAYNNINSNKHKSIYARTVSGTGSVYLLNRNIVPAALFNLNENWQRFDMQHSGTDYFYAVDFRGSSTLSEVLIFGAQLEDQSQATAYIKSDGIAAVRKATTTNEIVYSNDLTKSPWAGNGTKTYGQTGYEGNNDAWLLTKAGTSSSDYYNTAFTGVYTFSFYVKKEANKGVKIYNFGDSTQTTTINIENGTHIAGVNTVDIENITNDWLRVSVTLTVSNGKFYLYVTDGSGAQIQSSVIVQYFQVEQQTQAETYAPTTGIPVTIDLFKENNYGTMTNMSASDIVIDTPGVS